MNRSARRCRNSLRLGGYDYQKPGAYYVTICTRNRLPLLGRVEGEGISWTPAGHMVNETWQKLTAKFPTIALDESTIMPDHMHAIIWLHDLKWAIEHDRVDPADARQAMNAALRRVPDANRAPAAGRRGIKLANGQVLLPTLERVTQWLKSFTTRAYMDGVKQRGWPTFDRRLWQRGYHDRIIRDEAELARIRHYIRDNARRYIKRQA